MKWNGPDSIYSWFIALACCFINAMMFGVARLSGILFVASITRFNIGRKDASFPYTFSAFIRNLAGPLAGYLGHKFGVRSVTAFGALIGAAGASLCFFAESIDVITIFWGVVFGFGFGLGNSLLPISINQYFDKHRATASGISFSGACLGSFLLPPIVEILLNNYGLSQVFLFLSGFILNCVPAGMLLREPNFKIERGPFFNEEQNERQRIISRTHKPLYTQQNAYNSSDIERNRNSIKSTFPINNENFIENITDLTYKERMDRFSAHTSGYSVHMNSADNLKFDQSEEKSKRGCKLLQGEISGISFLNSKQNDNSVKNYVSDAAVFSLSDQYEQKIPNFMYEDYVSNDIYSERKKNDKLEVCFNESYQNNSYHADANQKHCFNKSPNTIYDSDSSKNFKTECLNQQCPKFTYLNEGYVDEENGSQGASNNIQQNSLELSKESEYLNFQSNRKLDNSFKYPITKSISILNAFSVILDPMFILIAVTNAIYIFSFLFLITIIIDFSRDLHIETSNDKYTLMLFSAGDITGRLGLGWITDNGYMKTTTFAAVSFACQGLFIAAIAWSNGFVTLAIFVTLYGLSQAGVIIIIPIIIAQFMESDIQTVAIPSSHFLSAPLCLVVAPLIGYFRDHLGRYDWIFYGLAMLSAASSVPWLFVPYIERCRRKRVLVSK